MKTCPFCAEEDLMDAAVVCKHCGSDLSPKPEAAALPAPPPPQQGDALDRVIAAGRKKPKRHYTKGQKILIGIGVILAIGIYVYQTSTGTGSSRNSPTGNISANAGDMKVCDEYRQTAGDAQAGTESAQQYAQTANQISATATSYNASSVIRNDAFGLSGAATAYAAQPGGGFSALNSASYQLLRDCSTRGL